MTLLLLLSFRQKKKASRLTIPQTPILKVKGGGALGGIMHVITFPPPPSLSLISLEVRTYVGPLPLSSHHPMIVFLMLIDFFLLLPSSLSGGGGIRDEKG